MWERRLARWLFIGVPAFLVLAVGGVFPWAEWTALAALVTAAALHALHRARAAKSAFLSPVALGGLAALGLTLLAALPLPIGLVGWLSPLAADAQHKLAAVSGHAADFVPWSLDAVSSLRGTRRIALYLLVFLLAVPLGRKSDTLRRVLKPVAFLGLGFVGVALANALTGDGTILGVFRPSTALYRGAATFVNPNHAAALLGMTLPVTAGLFLSSRGVRALLTWGGAALAQLALLLLTPSGNALVSPLFLGALFAFFALRRRGLVSRRKTLTSARSAIFLGLALLVGLVVVQAAFEPLREVVVTAARFDKLRTLREAAALIPRFPLVGLGPGAFLFGFGAFGPATSVALTAPESLPLQALLDFGLPGGLLVVAWPLLGLVRVARRAHDDRLLIGVAVALLGFVVHELADFAIDLPATGVLFFALFGLALGAVDDGLGRLAVRRIRVRWLVAVVAGVTVLGAGATYVGEQVLPRRALLAWSPEKGAPPPLPVEAIAAAGPAFPLDGRVWMRVGLFELRADRPDVARTWLEYAASAMPQSARILQTLARVVRRADPARHEALLHQLIERFWSGDEQRAMAQVADFVVDELAGTPALREHPRALLGDSSVRVRRYLTHLDTLSPEVKRTALGALLSAYGDDLPVLLLLDRPLRAPEVAHLRSLWLATLFAGHSEAPETWVQLALVERSKGRLELAREHLLRARKLRTDPDALNDERLIDLCLRLGRLDEAARSLATLEGAGLLPSHRRDLLKARLAVAQGRPEGALTILAHLLIDHPTDREALTLQAGVLESTGHWHEAREVYEHLYRLTQKKGYLTRAKRLDRKLNPGK